MADQKITELTADTSPSIDDLIATVNDPGGTPATRKMTLENLLKVINGLTADVLPDITSDYVVTYDASATAAKKVLLRYLGMTDYLGWMVAGETWTYASASTFTVSGDVTAKYVAGTRLKFTQSSTTKYAVVVSSSYSAPNTTVTIAVNTAYTIANASITNPYYSYKMSPAGYPSYFTFSPTWTNVTVGNGTLYARYSFDGRRVTGQVGLTLGSTSSISGEITISAPITPSVNYDYQPIGACSLVDTAAALYMGATVLRQGANTITLRAINAVGTYASWVSTSGTVPFTWGTGDQFAMEFSYYA